MELLLPWLLPLLLQALRGASSLQALHLRYMHPTPELPEAAAALPALNSISFASPAALALAAKVPALARLDLVADSAAGTNACKHCHDCQWAALE